MSTATDTAKTADGASAIWPASATSRIPTVPPKVRELFARRPTVGAGPAAQAVATDVSDLIRAEIDLAKAELTTAAQRKGMGAGLLAGAAVMGWLGLQGVLITIGFVIAIWLPGWAAALIVTAVLLLVAAVLALLGRSRLQTPLPIDRVKSRVQTDVDTAKAHLPGGDA